jgi:DNA-binding transcriptional LysR family regulator
MNAASGVTTNLARLDLVSLRIVVLCAERGNLSGAALAANISLSGASRRLRSVEDALGLPLFVRHNRGLMPTTAGSVAIRHGRLLLEAVQELGIKLNWIRDQEHSGRHADGPAELRGAPAQQQGR